MTWPNVAALAIVLGFVGWLVATVPGAASALLGLVVFLVTMAVFVVVA